MSRSRHVIRAADMHPGESTTMISDSSLPVSDVNARPSLQAEPATWIDRAAHVADRHAPRCASTRAGPTRQRRAECGDDTPAADWCIHGE